MKTYQRLSLFALFVIVASCFVSFAYANDEIKGPVIGIDLGTTYSCVGKCSFLFGMASSSVFPLRPLCSDMDSTHL
jgi:hypothetical protein